MRERGPRDHFTASHYAAHDIRGALPFLNPTRRRISLPLSGAKPAAPDHAGEKTLVDSHGETAMTSVTSHGAYHIWRSRDNRKGRHAVAVRPEHVGKSGLRPTSSLIETLKGIGKMFLRYPIWDVSYDVAMIYTIGMHETFTGRPSGPVLLPSTKRN